MNIYQRVENYFKRDKERLERKLRKELKHQMLKERFRGADLPEKMIGVITILTA